MRRREVIALFGGAAASSLLLPPLTARAQRPALPVVGFLRIGSAEANARSLAAFRKGLNETGYVEGQNMTVEYHWLEDHYDRMPAVLADLVRRQVAVIALPGNTPAALAAKAATATIPIVFGVTEDPVLLGLVTSLAQPGGNATGINFFVNEVVGKRLQLLHELVPKAVQIAVLVNPANPANTEPRCGTCGKRLPPSGCKSRSSTPARPARSTRPLPALPANAPMPCSSVATHSSLTAACNLPP